MTATLILANDAVRARARRWIDKAPEKTRVQFHQPTRTLDQNARMWAMLTDIATQTLHPVTGKKETPEDWKILFMRACGHETRYMTDLIGDPFPVGYKSSKLSVKQMVTLQDYIEWYGATHDVTFTWKEPE